MRHLMSPLDFTVEELDEFWIWQTILKPILKICNTPATAKSLQLYSTNRALEQDLVTKPQC